MDKYVFFPNLKMMPQFMVGLNAYHSVYLNLNMIPQTIISNATTNIHVDIFLEVECNFIYQDGMVGWDF